MRVACSYWRRSPIGSQRSCSGRRCQRPRRADRRRARSCSRAVACHSNAERHNRVAHVANDYCCGPDPGCWCCWGTIGNQVLMAQSPPVTRTMLQQKDLEGAEGREIIARVAQILCAVAGPVAGCRNIRRTAASRGTAGATVAATAAWPWLTLAVLGTAPRGDVAATRPATGPAHSRSPIRPGSAGYSPRQASTPSSPRTARRRHGRTRRPRHRRRVADRDRPRRVRIPGGPGGAAGSRTRRDRPTARAVPAARRPATGSPPGSGSSRRRLRDAAAPHHPSRTLPRRLSRMTTARRTPALLASILLSAALSLTACGAPRTLRHRRPPAGGPGIAAGLLRRGQPTW